MDQEIEKTLLTAERIDYVLPSEQLMARLKQIPTNIQKGYGTVPKRIVWAVAASIALLIAMNVLSLKNYSTEKQTSENTSNSYFDYLNTL